MERWVSAIPPRRRSCWKRIPGVWQDGECLSEGSGGSVFYGVRAQRGAELPLPARSHPSPAPPLPSAPSLPRNCRKSRTNYQNESSQGTGANLQCQNRPWVESGSAMGLDFPVFPIFPFSRSLVPPAARGAEFPIFLPFLGSSIWHVLSCHGELWVLADVSGSKWDTRVLQGCFGTRSAGAFHVVPWV